jgi:hypothetical protein
MSRKQKKKGYEIHDLVGIGLAFVIIGVTLGIGAYINSSIITAANFNATAESSTWRSAAAINNATAGLSTLASWLPIIGVIIAAAIIIGVLVHGFMGRKEGI